MRNKILFNFCSGIIICLSSIFNNSFSQVNPTYNDAFLQNETLRQPRYTTILQFCKINHFYFKFCFHFFDIISVKNKDFIDMLFFFCLAAIVELDSHLLTPFYLLFSYVSLIDLLTTSGYAFYIYGLCIRRGCMGKNSLKP